MSTFKPIPQDQRRELLGMLSNLSSYKYSNNYKKKPLPGYLKRASKQIDKWHATERKIQERASNAHDRKRSEIRREIYFGTVERALKLIKELEKILRA